MFLVRIKQSLRLQLATDRIKVRLLCTNYTNKVLFSKRRLMIAEAVAILAQ